MKSQLAGTLLIALGVVIAMPAAGFAQGTNVAVIDISQIFQQHQRFRGELESIKNQIKAFEESLKADQSAIERKTEQLRALKPGSPDYRQLETQLATMSADLQVKMGLKRKDFLEQEAKIYYQAYLEIQGVIREFSERNRIGLVLRFSGQEIDPQQRESVLNGINRAVVYQDRLNITGDILAMLNNPRAARTTAPRGPAPRSQVPRR